MNSNDYHNASSATYQDWHVAGQRSRAEDPAAKFPEDTDIGWLSAWSAGWHAADDEAQKIYTWECWSAAKLVVRGYAQRTTTALIDRKAAELMWSFARRDARGGTVQLRKAQCFGEVHVEIFPNLPRDPREDVGQLLRY